MSTKFDEGDVVVVVSCTRFSWSDYPQTKIGSKCIVCRSNSYTSAVMLGNEDVWTVLTRDIEFIQVVESPLYKALT